MYEGATTYVVTMPILSFGIALNCRFLNSIRWRARRDTNAGKLCAVEKPLSSEGWDPWDQDDMSQSISLSQSSEQSVSNQTYTQVQSGIWGVSFPRGGANDWRSGCFEWKGWKPTEQERRHCSDETMYRSTDFTGGYEDELHLYQILGVPPFSNFSVIRKGYRSMARRYHPDVTGNCAKAAEQFLRVQNAFRTLSDDRERKIYDAILRDLLRGRQHFPRDSAAPEVEENAYRLPECDLDEFRLL